jgi:hypothetical protein
VWSLREHEHPAAGLQPNEGVSNAAHPVFRLRKLAGRQKAGSMTYDPNADPATMTDEQLAKRLQAVADTCPRCRAAIDEAARRLAA